jgi:predicted HAD superfamily hydrolase
MSDNTNNESHFALHTFDVFDTIILRAIAQPVGIFAIMQEELAKDCYNDMPKRLRENFFHIIINSERIAARGRYQYDGKERIDLGEPTLERIYRYVGLIGKLTEEQIVRLRELEMNIELANIRLNDDIAAIIDELIDDGKRVAFISDMYLSSEFIKSLICKNKPNYKDIPLYVSNELGFGKSNGKAFEKVAAIENIPPNAILHRGDNTIADFDGALLAGVSAKIIDVEPLLPYEKLALERYRDNAYVQLAIGSARFVRKKANSSKSYIAGCSFAGPVLFPYVWYVLSTSKSLGINKLLFIARDGYILKMIADTIIQSPLGAEFIGIETSYFYASAKVWMTEDATVQELAKRYIEQEVRNPNGSISKFAFVDLHGTGRSVNSAIKLAKSFYNETIPCFYFTVYTMNEKYLQEYFSFCTKETFFIEVLCRAPNGKTVGYKDDNGRIIPIFSDLNIFPDNFSFSDYEAGICGFTQVFSNAISHFKIKLDNLILSEFYIDYASQTPNNEIAEIFGQILLDVDFNENNCTFAKQLTKCELLNMFLLRPTDKSPKFYCRSFDYEIAILLCSNASRKLIAFCNKHYNSLLGKLARRIFPEPEIVPRFDKERRIVEMFKVNNFRRILIYGFGKIGTEMIKRLKKSKLTIVGVADKNFDKMENVINPSELLNYKFDVILICIANGYISAGARVELQALGVDNRKIIEYADIN